MNGLEQLDAEFAALWDWLRIHRLKLIIALILLLALTGFSSRCAVSITVDSRASTGSASGNSSDATELQRPVYWHGSRSD